jgi:hypothetical protein
MFTRPKDWQIELYKHQTVLFTLLPYANSALQTSPQLSSRWKIIITVITQKNRACLMTTIYYFRKFRLRSLQFSSLINISRHIASQTGPEAHPASCKMDTGSFPGGKVRPEHDADPSTHSSAEVKNRVEIYIYSPEGPLWSMKVWNLPTLRQIITSCSRVHKAYILSHSYNGYRVSVIGLNLPGCGVNHPHHLEPRFKKE